LGSDTHLGIWSLELDRFEKIRRRPTDSYRFTGLLVMGELNNDKELLNGDQHDGHLLVCKKDAQSLLLP